MPGDGARQSDERNGFSGEGGALGEEGALSEDGFPGEVRGLRLWPVSHGLPARAKMLELIAEAKADDPLAMVTVVTTDGAGMRLLRRLVAMGSQDGLIAVAVLRLGAVAEKLVRHQADWSPKRSADDLVLGGVIRKVLATETGLFAQVRHHPATEQSLMRIVKELSDLSDDQLEQAKRCSNRAAAVIELYGQVHAKLAEHDLYLPADVMHQAAALVREAASGVAVREAASGVAVREAASGVAVREAASGDKAFAASTNGVHSDIASLGTVALYLPAEIKSRQAELIKALGEHIPVHVVAGVSGNEDADQSYKRLCKRLNLNPAASETAIKIAPEVASATTVQTTGVPAIPPVGHRIVSVSDADDEVRWVVRAVMGDLAAGVPASRIAILHATMNPYALMLADQLAAADVGWNGQASRRMSESVVGRFAGGLVDLIGTTMSRAGFFGVISNVLVLDAERKPVPVTSWERLARAANVIEGDDWEHQLQRHAKGLTRRLAEEEAKGEPSPGLLNVLSADIKRCAALGEFALKLKDSLATVEEAKSWPEFCDWLRDALHRYLGQRAKGESGTKHGRGAKPNSTSANRWPQWQQTAALAVQNALDQMTELASIEPQPSLDVMRRSLANLLNAPVSDRSSPGQGVFVGLLDSGIGLDAKRVYMLGMAEGVCPTRRRPDSMITEEERQLLGDALATGADHISRQYQNVLAVLAGVESVGGETTLLYPRGDLRRSTENVPSRWLLDTARALETVNGGSLFEAGYLDEENLMAAARGSATANITASASFTAGLLSTDFPATPQEFDAAELYELTHKSQHPVADVRRHRLFQADGALARGVELTAARRSETFTRFDGNLSNQDDLAGLLAGIFKKPVSASSLEKWVSCPRSYLFGQLLGVEAIEEPEQLLRMSPMQKGLLIHSVIDRLLRPLLEADDAPGPDRPYTEADKKRLNELLDEELAAAYEAGLTGHRFYTQMDMKALKDKMGAFIKNDEAREVRGKVVASEHRFGISDPGNPNPANPDLGNTDPANPDLGNTGAEPSPVEYPLPDGSVIKFRGSIDRVEKLDDGKLIVIDYKTGKPGSVRQAALEQDPTLGGGALQLPIYSVAAVSHFKSDSDAGVPAVSKDWQSAIRRAAYWFIAYEDGTQRRGTALADVARKRFDQVLMLVKTGIEDGLFPAYVEELSDTSDSWRCPYCSPDGLDVRQLRKQWAIKNISGVEGIFAGLKEDG